MTTDTCVLTLKKSAEKIEVTFVNNDIRLPTEDGQKQDAYDKGVISDYLLFQHKHELLIV